jgi:hypothetical protein
MLARIAVMALGVSLLASPAFADPGGDDRARWRTGTDRAVEYGIGLRARYVGVPRAVLESFVDEASSGVAHPGFGLELIRRRGGFEMTLGLEIESLSPDDGLWLDKGDTPPAQTPDLVEFEGFGWMTAEISLVWHTPVHDRVGLRYGGGFGIGVLRGDIVRTDTTCTGATTDTCTPIAGPGQGRYRQVEDVFPVMPVVGALVGAQIRPTDNLSINLEAGLRSVAYAGTSIAYFF